MPVSVEATRPYFQELTQACTKLFAQKRTPAAEIFFKRLALFIYFFEGINISSYFQMLGALLTFPSVLLAVCRGQGNWGAYLVGF